MFNSLKVKLTLAFGALIVTLFAVLGIFLVDAKFRELNQDLATASQNFARFTAEEVVSLSGQYLDSGNFVIFSRELQNMLRNAPEISDLAIIDYNGVEEFVLSQEWTEQYEGGLRTLSSSRELDRVQAQHLSYELLNGEVVYVKVMEDGTTRTVDANENELPEPDSRDRIADIVVPVLGSHAVRYEVDYSSLDTRLAAARMQIVVVALLGLLLTLMVSFMLSTGMTKPLKALKEGAGRIAKGDFSVRVKVKTKDEIGVLAGTFNKMAEDLKASTDAMIYQERVQKELELAADIQRSLLPEDKLEIEGMDVAGGLIPATEIGGDVFDYIEMEDGCQLIYLGDVTGHGVAAGILSSVANALLFGLRGEMDLVSIVDALNKVLREKTTPNVFVTMALTHWNPKTGVLTYVNAGHPPLLFYSGEKGKVMELKLQGMALGFVDEIAEKVQVQRFELKPKDTLVLYSDGVPEAVNARGEQYGLARARRIVQEACDDLYTAEGIKNAVLSDVIDYIGEKKHDDDITVVVLKKK